MQTEVNFLESKMITYGMDASSANKEKRTGVENYAYQVIEAMKREPLAQGERVVLFSPSVLTGELAELPSGWQSRVLKWSFARGWMQGRVSWELFRRPPNVLFVPAQGLPRFFFKTRLITTIHDVSFRRFGSLYDPVVRKRLTSVTKRAFKHATSLLTVSDSTRDEIRSFYPAQKQQLTVVPLATDSSIYRRLETEAVETVLRSLRLGQNFFLFVGRLEKKKNVTLLIRAFELFKQNRGVGDPFELVLVGEQGFGYEEIKSFIEHSLQKEFIREMGYLPDEQVAALFNAASAFCFPSWDEGFGLPTLEAMACGTVVLASDIPVHREVLANACSLIAPQDPEAWAQQMEKIVSDFSLKEQLIEQGTMRVAKFSWQQAARQTWSVLRSLV